MSSFVPNINNINVQRSQQNFVNQGIPNNILNHSNQPNQFNSNQTIPNQNNSRDAYNMKKIKKFNTIDQLHNKDDLKNLILKPQTIEKPNINIKALTDVRKHENDSVVEESKKKMVNNPYKGIIKDFNYEKKIKEQKDLVVHKVTEVDKDKKVFDNNMGSFKTTIKTQNEEIKDIYSIDKKTQHKKDFEYQHKYKYRSKLETGEESDLRVDRIEYYKKEQEKMEDNKKKIDNILLDLIDSGILSENLDSINYDKIDTSKLEETLKKTFGEDEFKKIMLELG